MLQPDDQPGAHQWPEQRADAAQQRHQNHLPRHVPAGITQRGELEHQRLGRSRQACQPRRQHEGHQLVGIGVIAQRDGARFILADGLQHLTKGGMHHAPDQGKGRHEDREHEVIEGVVVRQIEHAEQLTARHAMQAIFPVGERRLDEEEEHHLGQGQRDHREVDALPPDGQRPEQRPQHYRAERTGHDAQRRTQARVFREQEAGDIGARGQEGGMPEGQQPHEAEQQIEGAGEQRKAQNLHQKDGIGDPGRQQPEQEQHEIQHAQRGDSARRAACTRGLVILLQYGHVRPPFRTARQGEASIPSPSPRRSRYWRPRDRTPWSAPRSAPSRAR